MEDPMSPLWAIGFLLLYIGAGWIRRRRGGEHD